MKNSRSTATTMSSILTDSRTRRTRTTAAAAGTREPPRSFKACSTRTGVRHALIVGPNSGYGQDNRCLLDAIATGEGRFKGIAVVRNDIAEAELVELKAAGIVGVAYNVALTRRAVLRRHRGAPREACAPRPLRPGADRGRSASFASSMLRERSGARILIDPLRTSDRRGRRRPARISRAARPCAQRKDLRQAFGTSSIRGSPTLMPIRGSTFGRSSKAYTLDACVWGSDWPFLRAPHRVDYGPLVALVERMFPDIDDRRKLFWDTPRRVIGF